MEINWWMTLSNELYLPLRYWIAGQPSIFYLACQLLGRDKNAITQADTEIVIEGFPRSANTFSVIAFKYAQKRDIKISHHLHAQAQIIKGVDLKLPVCVLIRDPVDTIKSLHVAFPSISYKAGLKAYIKFYRDIYSLKEFYVVAKFEEVTTDFNLVIHKLNQKFDTKFREFSHSQESVSEVWEYIKKYSNPVPSNQKKRHIQIPTKTKEILKSKIEINDNENTKLIKEAQQIYEKMIL